MTSVPPPPTGYPPPPGRLAARAFAFYLRRLARRHFTAVHWLALDDPAGWPRGDAALPTLFVANHTNWWDGFLACLVSDALRLRFQILMEATNLARYRAFLKIGALPLRRAPARAAWADLARARDYLVPGGSLWIFPQGERRPAAERPRRCERGAAELVLGMPGPVRICPVAFRYGYLGEQLPEAFVLLGEPWIEAPRPGARHAAGAARRALAPTIETRLAATVDALDARLAGEDVGVFSLLVRGRLSVNKRMDRFRHAVGLLGGPFETRNG